MSSTLSPRKKREKPSGVTTTVVLAAKAAKIAKAVKAVKVMKPLLTFATAGISAIAYSWALGVFVGVGLVAMLFVHEMGHVLALRRKGMKASLPVFIPFLGAAIFAPSFGDRNKEAYVGYAGPLVGGIAALGLLGGVIIWGGSPAVRVVAYIAVYLNLFNLIPIRPLDGGRITQAVGPAFKKVGIATLLVLTIILMNPGLLIIWILVLTDIKMSAKLRLQIATLVFVVLMVMEWGNIGVAQPGWIKVVDAVVAGFFVLIFWGMYRHDDGTDPWQVADDRPQLPKALRGRWVAAYAAILLVLTGAFVVAREHVPQAALGHHTQETKGTK